MNKLIISLFFIVVIQGCDKANNIELFTNELKMTHPELSQYKWLLLIPSEGCTDCILELVDECNKSSVDSFFILISGHYFIEEKIKLFNERFIPNYYLVVDEELLNNKYKISYAHPVVFDLKKNRIKNHLVNFSKNE